MRLKVSNVCQLLDKSNYEVTSTKVGITWTNNGDGTITANGNVTSGTVYSAYRISLPQFREVKNNHKYALFSGINNINVAYVECIVFLINKNDSYFFKNCVETNIAGTFGFTIPQGEYSLLQCVELRVRADYTANNLVFKPQLFDLTEMYGAGNEPTTVAQFRQDFPNEMYEYSPVCWKKFRRLKYIANKEPVQLLDKSKYRGSSTTEGITFTNNGDGTWTVVGTAPDVPANKEYVRASVITWNLEFSKKHFIPGHKIVVAGGVSIDSAGKVADVQWVWGWTGGYDAANSWERTVHTIRQYPEDKLLEYSNYIELRVYAGATVNFTFKPQFFDLTEMYGAGNEPTTVAQFKADFPNELYDYNLYNYLTLNRGKFIANKEPVQLLDKSKYPPTGTSNGITYTKNEDGSYNVNGTIAKTGLSMLLIGTVEMVVGHIYLSNSAPVSGQKSYVENKYWIRDLQRWVFPGSRFQCGNYSAYAQITLLVNQTAGTAISDEKLCPELFDLTEMYGAGNEPTAEEFWSTHSKTTMYDYNPYNAITFR